MATRIPRRFLDDGGYTRAAPYAFAGVSYFFFGQSAEDFGKLVFGSVTDSHTDIARALRGILRVVYEVETGKLAVDKAIRYAVALSETLAELPERPGPWVYEPWEMPIVDAQKDMTELAKQLVRAKSRDAAFRVGVRFARFAGRLRETIWHREAWTGMSRRTGGQKGGRWREEGKPDPAEYQPAIQTAMSTGATYADAVRAVAEFFDVHPRTVRRHAPKPSKK